MSTSLRFAPVQAPLPGLRVGLATMQGLALAMQRQVVAVPTLEALAHAGLERLPSGARRPALVVPWMDAHRGEVFGAVYNVKDDVVSTERQPAAVGAGRGVAPRLGARPQTVSGPVRR